MKKRLLFNTNKIILLLLTLILISNLQCEEINNSTEVKKKKSKKQKKDNSSQIDYEYYKNFNLTAEIEKKYDEENGEKNSEYYKNLENIEVKKNKNKKNIKEEAEIEAWEEKIKNFTPESLLTVKVAKSEYLILYEEITVVPTKIVLAFYVHDEDSKIDFEVYSPMQKIIKKIKAKNRGFAELNIKVAGVYEFHLNNERFKTEKKVTLTLSTGENEEKKLSLDHLQVFFDKLSIVGTKIKEAHFSQKMINRKYQGHYIITKEHNKIIVSYSVIETIVMTMILMFQFLYIRNLINKAS